MRDQYTNPVINSDFPDPDIIRVGDTYYMASTTMYLMPGGDILPGGWTADLRAGYVGALPALA